MKLLTFFGLPLKGTAFIRDAALAARAPFSFLAVTLVAALSFEGEITEGRLVLEDVELAAAVAPFLPREGPTNAACILGTTPPWAIVTCFSSCRSRRKQKLVKC